MRRSVLHTTPLTPNKSSRKKQWDDTVHDLSQYKLTPEQIKSRKVQRQSINSIFRMSSSSPSKWEEIRSMNSSVNFNESTTPKKIRRPVVHTRNPSASQTPLIEPPSQLEDEAEESQDDQELNEQEVDEQQQPHVERSESSLTSSTTASTAAPSALDLLPQQQQLDNREFRLAQQVQKLEQEYEMMEKLITKIEQSQQVIQNNEVMTRVLYN